MGRWRMCARPGCLVLTANRWCKVHQAAERAELRARLDQSAAGQCREYKRARWLKFRAWWLNNHPLCYVCAEPATLVHHMDAHRGDPKAFWDGVENERVQSLCEPCHRIISGREALRLQREDGVR